MRHRLHHKRRRVTEKHKQRCEVQSGFIVLNNGALDHIVVSLILS